MFNFLSTTTSQPDKIRFLIIGLACDLIHLESIKRVSAQKDPNSLKRNINMYVISENSFGKLTLSNATIKDNLKTWLNQYRMINDTVDILDPYVINVGIDFILLQMLIL